MKAMETSQIDEMPAAVLKELPQTKMAPNPVSPVNMFSVTNGATSIPATNGETVVEETEKSSIENGESGISQPSVGVKRKDDGKLTKGSRAPNLKKMRLFTDTDDEDDPDDPLPQINGKSSDDDQDELKKRLENIPEKSKEMEAAQTEGINIPGEVTEASQPKETKENNESEAEDELQKRLENIPEKSKEMEAAQTEGINVLGEVTEALQPKETKENSENEDQDELQKRLENIPENSIETEAAQTEGIDILGEENSEYQKEQAKLKSKLRRLSRRELESMILKRLTEKILNQHDLGKLKQLSEKLKTTLENNRKKTVQFHKEIEDLKKVTQKLMLEHQARKGQYVPPVRIQRSVQIQATENNIKKGAMYTSTGTSTYKTISPRPGVSKVVHQTTQPTTPTTAKQQTQVGKTIAACPGVSKVLPQTSQPTTYRTAKQQTQMVRTGTPVQTLGTVKATNTSGPTQMLRVQPGQMVSVPVSALTAAVSNSSTSTVSANTLGLPGNSRGFTDMKDTSGLSSVGSNRVIRTQVAAPSQVSTSNTSTVNSVGSGLTSVGSNRMIRAQLAAPPQDNVMRAGQHLLEKAIQQPSSTSVPTSSAITITPAAKTSDYGGFIDLTDEDEGNRARAAGSNQLTTVVNVPTSSAGMTLQPPILQTPGGTAQLVLLNNAGTTVTTGLTTTLVSKPAPATVATGAVATATTQVAACHPAPLPRTPQQLFGGMRNLVPILTLKLPHKENSIVLSWTMNKTEDLDSIASYLLYSYQEGTAPPSSKLWKKVGSVKALELPMACTLTQFKPGHVYHFAVRAVDRKSCLGPFSQPRSIRLDR